MTTFRNTIEEFKAGNKEAAYSMFKNDPNSNGGISFETFCTSIEKTIGNIHAVSPATKKTEVA